MGDGEGRKEEREDVRDCRREGRRIYDLAPEPVV